MSLKSHCGNNRLFSRFMFNEKEYECIDPTDFLINLFTFREENRSYFPKDHWDLVLLNIVGGMGSGKSVTMQNIAKVGYEIYQNEFDCFQTNDIIYALNYLNQNIETRKKVEFIFFDDALTMGMDSRQSMRDENIGMSQNLAILRHLLANENENKVPDPRVKNGFCVVCYGIQSPTRLDLFIRQNSHLSIYKNYYENLEKEKRIPSEAIDFIRDVTEEAMYKHNYFARGSGLGITKTKKSMLMYFDKCEFKIPTIAESDKSIDQVLNELIALDLDKMKLDMIKGFVYNYCDLNKIHIPDRKLLSLIYKAKYLSSQMKEKSIIQNKVIGLTHFINSLNLMNLDNNYLIYERDPNILWMSRDGLGFYNEFARKKRHKTYEKLSDLVEVLKEVIDSTITDRIKRFNVKQKRCIPILLSNLLNPN